MAAEPRAVTLRAHDSGPVSVQVNVIQQGCRSGKSEEMKAQLLRKMIYLEQREQARCVPHKASFPAWLIEIWREKGLGVCEDGRIDWLLTRAKSCLCVAYKCPETCR